MEEQLQRRYEWFQETNLEQKFRSLAYRSLNEMLTREERENFYLQCKNQGILQTLFASLLDWKGSSKWQSLFFVFLFTKNPELISFYIHLV